MIRSLAKKTMHSVAKNRPAVAGIGEDNSESYIGVENTVNGVVPKGRACNSQSSEQRPEHELIKRSIRKASAP